MAEITQYDKPRFKALGAFFTISFHGGLILALLFYYLSVPDPPFPEGGGGDGMGIEVNLGSSDVGTGVYQEDIPDFIVEESQAIAQAVASSESEEMITSEESEAEAINTQKEDKKKETKKNRQNIVTTNTAETKNQETTEEVVENKQTVNTRALYRKGTTTTNQGQGGGTGDQGKPNGNPFSNSYTGDGTGGTGNGSGAGGGTGGGFGTGTGTGVGSGISFRLDGRIKQYLPHPQQVRNQGGIVVVSIKVDREGKVVEAKPGAKGSTTLNENLLRAATEAASNTRFERKPDAPEFQVGTITYNFVLQ